jgi:hypothetical protein
MADSDSEDGFVYGGNMVTAWDFGESDQGFDEDEDETRGNSPEKKRHSGHNAGNDAKHSKLLAEITKLMQQHYLFNEDEGGHSYALCAICSGSFELGRIT